MSDDVKKMWLFRIYTHKKQRPGKVEGYIYPTDARGKLTKRLEEEHFDQLSEIPLKLEKLLQVVGKEG